MGGTPGSRPNPVLALQASASIPCLVVSLPPTPQRLGKKPLQDGKVLFRAGFIFKLVNTKYRPCEMIRVVFSHWSGGYTVIQQGTQMQGQIGAVEGRVGAGPGEGTWGNSMYTSSLPFHPGRLSRSSTAWDCAAPIWDPVRSPLCLSQ